MPVSPTRVHISARVTVFFAAAGFGKTFAMADICEKLRGGGASVEWLSCAALALPSGDLLQGIHRFFELFSEADTVFIDDLEVLSPEQRKAVLRAFGLTDPRRKIVLATRSLEDLGLGRLIADGAVQMIHADALRWRRRQLSDLWKSRLTAKQVDLIDGVAQGWPAVSQLLARFFISGGDLPAGPALLNASLASDYIRTEILASFTSSDLVLLSMTSLIAAFDDSLLKALAPKSALTCEALIRRLPGLCAYRADGVRLAYNRALSLYLQQIFAGLPDGSRVQALTRMADWASTHGDVVLAGDLAAQAGDRRRIVDYIAKAGGLKIHVTKGYDDLRTIVTAAGETLVATEPRLKLLKCFVLLKDGQVGEASRLYQEAAASLPSDPDTELGAAFVRLSLMVYGCQLAAMSDAELESAARGLARDPAYREIAPTVLAIMHSQQADFAAAKAAIAVARAYGREAGLTYNVMYLEVHSAAVALASGDLEGARTHLAKARLRWREEFANDQAAETVMLSLSAQWAFERGNIRLARQYVGKVGHRLAHSEAWLDIYFAGYEPVFRLLAREQGLPTALSAVDRSVTQLQEIGLERIGAGLRDMEACLIGEAILKGGGDFALAREETVPDLVSGSWQEKEFRLLAAAYRGLANQAPDASVPVLDRLIRYAREHGLLRTQLRALLLRHAARGLLGHEPAAIEDFHAALEIGARTGMRQAFLEFGSDAVKSRLAVGVPDRFSPFARSLSGLLITDPSKGAETPLTRREAQVLEILSSGASDKGIARQLQVTEFAVRFHLKNIYRKLGVRDRNSAIGRRGLN